MKIDNSLFVAHDNKKGVYAENNILNRNNPRVDQPSNIKEIQSNVRDIGSDQWRMIEYKERIFSCTSNKEKIGDKQVIVNEQTLEGIHSYGLKNNMDSSILFNNKELCSAVSWLCSSSFEDEYSSLASDHGSKLFAINSRAQYSDDGILSYTGLTTRMLEEALDATNKLLNITEKMFDECDDLDAKQYFKSRIVELRKLSSDLSLLLKHSVDSLASDTIGEELQQVQKFLEAVGLWRLLQVVANDDLINEIKESYLSNTNKEGEKSRISIMT